MPVRGFGGAAGTHHTMTARRMVAKGWVLRRDRNPGFLKTQRRASLHYRITPAGAQALACHFAGASLLEVEGRVSPALLERVAALPRARSAALPSAR